MNAVTNPHANWPSSDPVSPLQAIDVATLTQAAKNCQDLTGQTSDVEKNAPNPATMFYVDRTYPRTKNDVDAAFVGRGLAWLQPGGLLGAITSRTGFFRSSFQTWREEILLGNAHPTVFADLGYGVLDTAMVETAAYYLAKR